MIMIGLTMMEGKYRIYRSIADYIHEIETRRYLYIKLSVDILPKVDSFESKQIVGQTVLISYISKEDGEKIITVKIPSNTRSMRNAKFITDLLQPDIWTETNTLKFAYFLCSKEKDTGRLQSCTHNILLFATKHLNFITASRWIEIIETKTPTCIFI